MLYSIPHTHDIKITIRIIRTKIPAHHIKFQLLPSITYTIMRYVDPLNCCLKHIFDMIKKKSISASDPKRRL